MGEDALHVLMSVLVFACRVSTCGCLGVGSLAGDTDAQQRFQQGLPLWFT